MRPSTLGAGPSEVGASSDDLGGVSGDTSSGDALGDARAARRLTFFFLECLALPTFLQVSVASRK